MVKTFEELSARMRADNRSFAILRAAYNDRQEAKAGTKAEQRETYYLLGYLGCLLEEDYITTEEFEVLAKLLQMA